MKKIGLLCLALVLALGSLGVAYAGWTDTITIDGTVNTGNVDIDIVAFSGTWVYKVPDAPNELVWQHGWGTAGDRPTPPANGTLISYAETTFIGLDPDGTGSDYAIVEFDNLFPSTLFFVDFLVHYNGSIPAIVTAEISGDPWIEALWNAGHAYYAVYESDENGTFDPANLIEPPQQVHYCEYYIVKLFIHLPQITEPGVPFTQAALEGLDGSFTATLNAIQWNEAP